MATLRFESIEREAWLVDLVVSAARSQGDLCQRHASALVLPRGWDLHDQRTEGGPPRVERDVADPASRASRLVRRAADVAARRAVSARAESSTNGRASEAGEDATGDVAPEDRVARPGAAHFGTGDDELEPDDPNLDAVLDAQTPLLRRAFRNALPK